QFTRSVSASSISDLNQFPYLRLKVKIETTGANPPCLTAISYDVEPSPLSDLELKGGFFFCGQTRTSTQEPGWSALSDLLVFFMTLAMGAWIARRPWIDMPPRP